MIKIINKSNIRKEILIVFVPLGTLIESVAKKSDLIISNDTGPGHIAALSNSPILFLAKDNVISKSNLSEYKNAYTILTDTMDSISVKQVLDFLHDSKLTNK